MVTKDSRGGGDLSSTSRVLSKRVLGTILVEGKVLASRISTLYYVSSSLPLFHSTILTRLAVNPQCPATCVSYLPYIGLTRMQQSIKEERYLSSNHVKNQKEGFGLSPTNLQLASHFGSQRPSHRLAEALWNVDGRLPSYPQVTWWLIGWEKAEVLIYESRTDSILPTQRESACERYACDTEQPRSPPRGSSSKPIFIKQQGSIGRLPTLELH